MSSIEQEVLYRAINDPSFARGSFKDLPLSSFEGTAEHKIIYQAIRDHYQEDTDGTPLTERLLKGSIEQTLTRREKQDSIAHHYKEIEGIYAIKEIPEEEAVMTQRISEYVRGRLFYKALTEYTSSGKELGDDEELKKLIPKIQEIATTHIKDSDSSLIRLYDSREIKRKEYTSLVDNRYRTGFTQLDSISGGGLARGEVGIILAKSGAGKTSFVVQLHNNYSKQGLNTLYISLEERTGRMLLKLEQNLLGIGRKVLFDEAGVLKQDMFDKIQDLYAKQTNLGEAFLSSHSPQEVSTHDIERIITDIRFRYNIHIDVVIIDYPDLMYNTHYRKGNSESDAGGKLMEDIRALAKRQNFVCWTLSQLNRDGWGGDLNSAKQIEGSKRKLNAVEVALTLNQTPEEFEKGIIRLNVDKMRYNSETNFEKMLYFKVAKEGIIIKDESPEEIQWHKNFLDGKDTRQRDEKREQTVSDINNSLGALNNVAENQFGGNI